MSDHETESFTPYEPQTSYDWDYGDEPPRENRAPNVLWGRLITLGCVLLLVFLVGRWSAPNGADPEKVEALRADYEAAQEEIDQLKAALTQPTEQATPDPEVTVGDQTDEAEDAEFNGKTYVVQSGDTMVAIADRFCGDPAKDELIADFNGISDPTLISVGTELKIPEDCAQ